MKYAKIALLMIAMFCLVTGIAGQTPCKPPEIVFNKDIANIFTEEQETYLGDVMAETLDKNFAVLRDEEATAYLRQIGERLIKHLPPTNLKFRFFLVDAPEINAFSVAGGRIYVTRKLVSFVRSEDELAGIIGHELGHSIVRHHSSDMSKLFKEILGVQKVGDRKDVFDRFNEFIDRQRTKRVRLGGEHLGDQQLEADRIGLFAMMAAGYDPNAAVTAWERLTDRKGKVGSGIGDLFFGKKSREERRLRELIKTIGSMSPACRETSTARTGDEFLKWQSYVVSISSVRYTEKLSGLISRGVLKPALRGSIERFQFSPDGQLIIAKDASGINILKREPFSFLFRANIPNARLTQFSPDSKSFVVLTGGLRVEHWDIETRKPTFIREVYSREQCIQTSLSPDGKTFVCFTLGGQLDVVDVATNEKLISKEKFYVPYSFELFFWARALAEDERALINAIQIEYSPDGRYLLAGRGRPPGIGTGEGFLGFDIPNRKEIKLDVDLKKILASPFAFYSADRVIGLNRYDADESGIFTFPEGKRVEKLEIAGVSFKRPFKGDYIIVRPANENPVGAYDLSTKKLFVSGKKSALDGWGEYFVAEGADGIIDLLKVTANKVERVSRAPVPPNELADVKSVAVSDDLATLVLSHSMRGAIWDLTTGLARAQVTGFRGTYIDPNSSVYVDIPSDGKLKRSIGRLENGNATATDLKLEPLDLKGRLAGRFLVRVMTRTEEELEKRAQEKKEKSKGSGKEDDDDETFFFFMRDGVAVDARTGMSKPGSLIEVSDIVTRKKLWTMRFELESPRYTFDRRSETIALYWPVTSKTAKERIQDDPELTAKLKSMGEKDGDYLVQVLSAETGEMIGSTLIETGEGSFSIKRLFMAGDTIAIADSENRILFYSLKTRDLISRVFGQNATLSSAYAIAAVENISGVISIVDIKTGRQIDEVRFPRAVAYATFDKAGKKLFVLTTDQKYYIFDAAAFGS